MKISRQAYADMFGPTVGDKVRLADTDLWIEVEEDRTFGGEEVVFGGGKDVASQRRRHGQRTRRLGEGPEGGVRGWFRRGLSAGRLGQAESGEGRNAQHGCGGSGAALCRAAGEGCCQPRHQGERG